ncbi:hypothetical protein [Microbacterium sp. NPDC087591]|uniref:hypothetical protein n=1 Tax=Microbacterium sp. NPDC087591 TaxID=3364192 RepID=UPI00381BA92A
MPRLHPAPHLSLAACCVALSVIGLLGCSPAPEPEPTPTPAFASEEEAFATAEETYRAYIDASNSIDLQRPETFKAIEAFTTGKYQADERKSLSDMHAEGYLSGGAIMVESFEGLILRGDQSVIAKACNDVSHTVLTDRDGVSLVAPDRPDRYALDLEFILIDGSLRIASSDVAESDTCAAR